MESNLKREIILDNYQHPQNKGLIEDDSYEKVNMNNESCIDDITLMIKIKDNTIIDIRFEAEACAVSTATTSIMIKQLIGLSVEDAKKIVLNYKNMVDEKDYDQSLLGEANAFDEISRQPNRKKCALLPWWGIEKILNKY